MASPSFAEDVLNNKRFDMVYCAKIMHALFSQQKTGELCDVKILVENHPYYVHRCIIATTSEQLHSQISNLSTIELVGVTKQGFETLLEILYTGKLTALASLSLEAFHELLKAADALDAGTVMDYCMREHPNFMSQILENRDMNETVEIKTVSRGSKRLSRMRDEGFKSMGVVALKSKKFIPNSTRPSKSPLVLHNDLKSNGVSEGETQTTTSIKPQEVSNPVKTEDEDEGGTHMCSLCGKLFKYAKYLSKHVKYGGCANRLNCFYCPRKYKRQQDLKKHVTQYHSEYLVKTNDPSTRRKSRRGNPVIKYNQDDEEEEVVEEEEPKVEEAPEEVEEVIAPTEFKCLVCNQKFNSKRGLQNHQRQHRSSYRCKICEKIFFNFKNYRIHKAKKCHQPNGGVSCKICGKICSRDGDLRKHMMYRHPNRAKTENEKPETGYRCKICNKRLRSKVQLRNHMSEHDDEEEEPRGAPAPPQDVEMTEEKTEVPPKPKVVVSEEDDGFACIHCGNIFNSLSTMRKHVNENHSAGIADVKVFDIADAAEEKVVYTCETCNENFDDTSSLEAHVAIHDNAVIEPTVTCDTCKVVFSNQDCYDIHACIKQEITTNGYEEKLVDEYEEATVDVTEEVEDEKEPVATITPVENEKEEEEEEDKEAAVIAID